MSETVEIKKADPKYDWRPVISKLALGYRQVYGDQIDVDTITEYVREQNDITPLVGFEEWDYAQGVVEHLMKTNGELTNTGFPVDGGEFKDTLKPKSQIPDIPEPEPEDNEPPEPQGKTKKTEPKKNNKKKKTVERVEQGHLEFTCYKTLLQNFSKKMMVAVDEILFIADDKGILSRMVDPSHVLMVEAFIPFKDFYTGNDCINKKITYNIDKKLEVGINLSEFYPTLRILNSYDKIHGTINDMEIKIETISDNPLRRSRKPIEVFGNVKAPEIKFTVEAEVDRSELSMLHKATGGTQGNTDSTSSVADKVEFISDGKNLKVIMPDYDDAGDTSIILSRESKGVGKALYSADYLRNILSAMTESRPVKIRFSTDSPMKLSGRLQDSGYYWYLLAPRIESE